MKYFAFLFVIISLCTPAAAQETRARITGVVSDGQGSVVPGVTVTALNTDTNVSTETVTNASGAFTIQQLVPGPYRLTATLQGFKTFQRDGLELHTAETVSVNVPLTVGALEETITVSAQTSAIESNESTIAQTIENKRITELPLNGRQVYMLMQLTAGTIFTQTTFGATGFSGTRAWDVNGSLSVHGSRTGNNEFLVEGAPSAGTGGGTGNWNYAPPVDAIEEFKIGTSAVDASFGRTSGGVINMTLRSGTNNLRGSGIILHRGTWLDSNQIQNIRNNISNEGHKYYNAEGMFSGPIARNKTFFMGGYQGFYEDIPFPVTRTVPTDAQLRGDFSQTTTANGTPILIYDPATTQCNANFSSCTRQPFPGNVIPQDRWHPIARSLLPYIPRDERDAEQPLGVEQLHQLAEHRPLPLQLVPDAHRPRLLARTTGCRSATAATGASSTGTRTRCPSRRSAATTTRRIATTTWSRSTTTTRSTRRRCGTRASPGIGSTSRTTRSTATSIHSCRSPAPTRSPGRRFRRSTSPATRACSRGRSASRRTTPSRSTATSRRRSASTSSRPAASTAPTSSSASTRSTRTASSISTTTSPAAIR